MVMFSGTAHRSHRYIVAWSSGDTATCGTQACLCPATRRKTRVFSIYLPPQLFSWVRVNNSDTFRFLQVSTGFNRLVAICGHSGQHLVVWCRRSLAWAISDSVRESQRQRRWVDLRQRDQDALPIWTRLDSIALQHLAALCNQHIFDTVKTVREKEQTVDQHSSKEFFVPHAAIFVFQSDALRHAASFSSHNGNQFESSDKVSSPCLTANQWSKMIAEHEIMMRHLEPKVICPSNLDGSSWLLRRTLFFLLLPPGADGRPWAMPKESSTSHQSISTAQTLRFPTVCGLFGHRSSDALNPTRLDLCKRKRCGLSFGPLAYKSQKRGSSLGEIQVLGPYPQCI